MARGRSPGAGLLVVVSGPSGVGKGTLVERLVERAEDVVVSTSVTTRAPRPGEVEGVHYRFVDGDTFDELIASGELLEWAHIHGHRSGTPRAQVDRLLAEGRVVLLEIDVQGALAVRAQRPAALLVFVAPPTRDELTRRRAARGTETAEQLAVREADADRELAASDAFDHVVVNDDLDGCVERVAGLIAEAREG